MQGVRGAKALLRSRWGRSDAPDRVTEASPGGDLVVEVPPPADVAAPAVADEAPAEREIPVVRSCAAPATNLRFEPDGSVTVCCVNSRYPVGHVAQSTIREIWEGPPIRKLGAALAADDYSLGCMECAAEIEVGLRDATYAPTFDRFVPNASPDWPRRIEFAVSNRCNLMCVQCTGELSSAIRSRREHRPPIENHYDDAFFEQLPPFLAEAEAVVFLGGEPFLQPQAWRIFDQLLELDPADRPTVDVTTNGTIWNERTERYVRELKMTVAVSIDAVTPEVGEAIRVGSTHTEVLANMRRLRDVVTETQSGFGINACIMRENWEELPALFTLGDEVDADVEAIVITYPRERSLLLLPTDELQVVVEGLEAHDAEMQATLERNLPHWDAVLDRLRAYVAGVTAVPVEITHEKVHVPYVPLQDLLIAERERLVADGAEPVELLAIDDVVREVADQTWAADLGVSSWIGSPVGDLVGRLAAQIGTEPVVEVHPTGTDLVRVAVGLGPRQLAVVIGEWFEDGHRHLRVMMTEAAS